VSTEVGERRGGGGPETKAGGISFEGRSRWLLVVCCVAQFMVILDLSIVNVALPSIQSSLGFSAVGLQWVVDAYAIAFAGFLMFGGRASDHFGQRRLFVAALLLFSLTSLAGGMAPTQTLLVVARGVQGLSGALMAASSLAIVTYSFEAGPKRHKAIALWGAMNGAGGAAGTLLGGVLTSGLGWRWVLLINPPIGIIAAFIALAVVAERRKESERSDFDLFGALLLTASLVLIVYGVVNAGNSNWLAPLAIGPIAGGLVLSGVFGYVETHLARKPLIPFRSLTRPVLVANAVVLLFSGALFPMWYVSSLYLQQVLGLTPLATGLAFLPMALLIMFSAHRAGGLVSRFGPRPVLVSGLLLMLTGMLLFVRIGPSGSAVGYIVLPGLLVAAGIGLSIVPSTIAAIQGSAPEQAGLVSGLVNTARQSGGGLGIALLISLATEFTTHFFGENKVASVALTDGYRLAYLIGAGFVLAALVVAFLFMPRTDNAPARSQPKLRLSLPIGVGFLIVAFLSLDFGVAGGAGAPIGAWSKQGAYDFVSAPNLHPPRITVTEGTASRKTLPGDVMVGNFYNLTTHPMDGQSGPLLLAPNLTPIWFRPTPPKYVASDLAAQIYERKPVLSWWQGIITPTGATESGEYIVVNEHYKTIAKIKGQDGWVLTLHSFIIKGKYAYVTANKNIPMNLYRYGGTENGAITDSAVQKYDLKTGKLVWSWNALHHIPLSASHAIPQTNGFPWDAYHVNSISLGHKDTLVVSMRNTWAAYDINVKTKKIVWTLGGRHSSFKLPKKAMFEWQHDVVMNGRSTITMFDDHCCQISGAGTYVGATAPSRALVLHLNRKTHTATLKAQYVYGKSFDAAYMGSTQLLPNGDVLVGWGAQPELTEYTHSGKLIFNAQLPGPDLSYRAVLVRHWVGKPLTLPRAVARPAGDRTKIYVSWNGATEVARWRVLAEGPGGRFRQLLTAPKRGFQSVMLVSSRARRFKVEALDSAGRVLRSSRVFGIERKFH
jgi:EmrB/QacA subfamily drug resistance transporter